MTPRASIDCVGGPLVYRRWPWFQRRSTVVGNPKRLKSPRNQRQADCIFNLQYIKCTVAEGHINGSTVDRLPIYPDFHEMSGMMKQLAAFAFEDPRYPVSSV